MSIAATAAGDIKLSALVNRIERLARLEAARSSSDFGFVAQVPAHAFNNSFRRVILADSWLCIVCQISFLRHGRPASAVTFSQLARVPVPHPHCDGTAGSSYPSASSDRRRHRSSPGRQGLTPKSVPFVRQPRDCASSSPSLSGAPAPNRRETPIRPLRSRRPILHRRLWAGWSGPESRAVGVCGSLRRLSL